MNRYDSPSDSQKNQACSSPWGFSSSIKKPSYKLAIPEMTQPDTLRIDTLEPFDPQIQIRANELTFKRQQQSMSSGRNPFSEDYLRINTTENTRLNVSIGNSEIFEKEALDSPILMEIPNERHTNLNFTTYKNSKENIRPLETSSENYIPTNDTVTKTNKSFFMAPPSIEEVRTRTLPDTDIKMKERNTSYEKSFSSNRKLSIGSKSKANKKHYEDMLEEILQREKENRLSTKVATEQNGESPMTPKLGRSPSRSSSVTHRRKSKCVHQKKPDRDITTILREEPKETLEKIKMSLEEVNKEKEYLKAFVHELKVLIKKEQDEVRRIEKSTKAIDFEMNKLNHKQKQVGKSGIDTKDQLRKTKDEVLKLLEEVETTRKCQTPLVEKINEEKDSVEVQKKKVEVLKINLTQDLKEKEIQKESIANARRVKQRLLIVNESLEREKQAFMTSYEQHMAENYKQQGK